MGRKTMVFVSLAGSLAAALAELLTRGWPSVWLWYGFGVPILLLAPRLVFFLSSSFRTVVNRGWARQFEQASFYLVIIEAPGSLALHRVGIQYDRLLHFGAAFFIFLFTLYLWLPVEAATNGRVVRRKRVIAMATFMTVVALVGWEAYQASADQLLGTQYFFDTAQNISRDVPEDVTFGLIGMLAAVVYAYAFFERFKSIVNHR